MQELWNFRATKRQWACLSNQMFTILTWEKRSPIFLSPLQSPLFLLFLYTLVATG